MTTKISKENLVEVPAIDIRTIGLRIVGDTPLIVHAWDEKTKREMLEKMMGKAKSKLRDLKDPFREFIYSMYWLDSKKERWLPEEVTEENLTKYINDGNFTFGFKSIAFKASAATGGYRSKVTKNAVDTFGALYIAGEYVTIKGTPYMREDMVRVANGAPDIRYRGCFPEWETELTIKYNAGVFSKEQVVNLFNLGGFTCGVGEWRPEKKGQFGMYHVG